MATPYALTPAHRLILADAFRTCPRVDTAIDCVIEGQLGRAIVADADRLTAFGITVGPFWYFAGAADGDEGEQLLRALPPYGLLMPSTAGWHERARALYGATARSFPRFSFSSAQLSVTHLDEMLEATPLRTAVTAIDVALARQLSTGSEPLLDLADFDSAEDFVARSFGYVLLDEDRPQGIAYASLVCSHSIEVSLFVGEAYRRRGVATVLSGQLVRTSLRRGLRPNWDAANPESCALAEKLGFRPSGSYEALYHTGA